MEAGGCCKAGCEIEEWAEGRRQCWAVKRVVRSRMGVGLGCEEESWAEEVRVGWNSHKWKWSRRAIGRVGWSGSERSWAEGGESEWVRAKARW